MMSDLAEQIITVLEESARRLDPTDTLITLKTGICELAHEYPELEKAAELLAESFKPEHL